MLTSILLFMGIGTPELLVILFAILLLFGGNKLPELARGLGKGIREFKDASDGVKREFHRNIDSISDDLDVEDKKAKVAPSSPAQSGSVSNDVDESGRYAANHTYSEDQAVAKESLAAEGVQAETKINS